MAQLTFLGTGTSSGVPMIACQCDVCLSKDDKDNRLRSSVLIQSETTTIVIDATPDFRQQMLREKITGIDAVLLTHPHKDHIGGLDDTRAFQYYQQRPTRIYGNKLSIEGVKKEIPYAFGGPGYPGLPSFELQEISLSPFTIGDITITPVLVEHYRMPVYGYRFGDLAYITDANSISQEEKEKLKGCNVLIVNALRKEQHLSHFSLREAIELVKEAGAKQAFFTHISHQMGKHAVINSELPFNMQLAYDGLRIHF